MMSPSKVDGTEHQGDSSTQKIELHPQNGPPSVFLAVLRRRLQCVERAGKELPTYTSRYRLAVPDHNLAVETVGVLDGNRRILLRRVPAESLPGRVEDDDCDAVLLPTGLLPDLTGPAQLLSGSCLACRGQGRCVVVATRGDDPRTVQTVAADHPKGGLEEPHEAALLIGSEPKLPPGYIRPVHVGRLWFELTGLPMVMSCWAVGSTGPPEGLEELLAEVTAEGISRQRGICSGGGCMEPLTEEHVDGLTEFFQRCHDISLIDHVPRPKLPANHSY